MEKTVFQNNVRSLRIKLAQQLNVVVVSNCNCHQLIGRLRSVILQRSLKMSATVIYAPFCPRNNFVYSILLWPHVVDNRCLADVF